MKKLMLLAVLVMLTGVCFGKDVYSIPKVATGDTIIVGGKLFRLWGIRSVGGYWGEVARMALLAMSAGREVKFLEDGKHPGVLRYGMYDRSGKRQINAALKLVRMGLAFYEPADLPKDEKVHKYYREAQETAKRLKVGIWSD